MYNYLPVRESYDFGWTDECEVQWVKEEDEIFSFEVGKLNFLEVVIDHRLGLEIGRRLLDLGFKKRGTDGQKPCN